MQQAHNPALPAHCLILDCTNAAARGGAPPPAKRAKVGERGARSATPKPKRLSQELWRPRTRTAIGAHSALAPRSQSPERLLGALARASGAARGAREPPTGSPLTCASTGKAAGSAAAALRDGHRMTETQAREACARGVSAGGGSTSGVKVHMRAGRPHGVSAGGGSPPRSPWPAAKTPGRATGLTGHRARRVKGHTWGVSLACGSLPGSPAPASGHPPQSRPALARVGNDAAGSAGAAADLARLAGGFAEGLAAAGSAALLEALAQRLLSSDAFGDVIVARLGANDAAARGIVERLARSAAFVEAVAAQDACADAFVTRLGANDAAARGVVERLAGSAAFVEAVAAQDAYADAFVARLGPDDAAARGVMERLAGSVAFEEAFAAQVCNPEH